MAAAAAAAAAAARGPAGCEGGEEAPLHHRAACAHPSRPTTRSHSALAPAAAAAAASHRHAARNRLCCGLDSRGRVCRCCCCAHSHGQGGDQGAPHAHARGPAAAAVAGLVAVVEVALVVLRLLPPRMGRSLAREPTSRRPTHDVGGGSRAVELIVGKARSGGCSGDGVGVSERVIDFPPRSIISFPSLPLSPLVICSACTEGVSTRLRACMQARKRGGRRSHALSAATQQCAACAPSSARLHDVVGGPWFAGQGGVYAHARDARLLAMRLHPAAGMDMAGYAGAAAA